jgi:hypothetical protein
MCARQVSRAMSGRSQTFLCSEWLIEINALFLQAL